MFDLFGHEHTNDIAIGLGRKIERGVSALLATEEDKYPRVLYHVSWVDGEGWRFIIAHQFEWKDGEKRFATTNTIVRGVFPTDEALEKLIIGATDAIKKVIRDAKTR
jgi:hypothetical protein